MLVSVQDGDTDILTIILIGVDMGITDHIGVVMDIIALIIVHIIILITVLTGIDLTTIPITIVLIIIVDLTIHIINKSTKHQLAKLKMPQLKKQRHFI